MDLSALLVTLKLAAVTTIVLLAIAVPLAGLIAFSGSRWRFALEAAVALPLMLPPTVLGFYLLVAFSPLHWFGRAAAALLGHSLAFSFAGLLVGSLVYSLPFAVQPMVAGLRTIDPRLLEAAATLGAGPAARLLRVALPASRASVMAAAVLTFTHTVGEFGVVLMLGGSIPGETRTLSIALYDLVESAQFDGAERLALLLLAVSTLALTAVYALPALRSARGTR